MDGNRRWAQQRGLHKAIGHASGAKRVRGLVEACSERGIRWVTQDMTAHHDKITLTIAANYGGRWDMLQAVQALQAAHPGQPLSAVDEDALRPISAWPTHPTRTSSSAPVVSSASATSCSGRPLIRSCISPTRCGPMSARRPWVGVTDACRVRYWPCRTRP